MSADENEVLRDIFDHETIAVIGCSSTPRKAAHEVPAYLQRHGYEIVPVNPFADEILGRESYDSIADVNESIDVVEVFRPSEEVSDIVDEVLTRRTERGDVEAIWMQLRIRDDEAAERARDAGLTVVQDRCMKVEHGMLVR